MKVAWLLVAVLLAGHAPAAHAQIPLPRLEARVTDLTGTLTAAQQSALEDKLAAFEARKGAQIAVLILPTTEPEDIAQFGVRLLESWKLGRKGVDDGAVLIVAKDDRAMRIEVGRDPGQPRPGADRRGPVRAAERRGDQRQAAGGQQRAADALQGPARDEQRKVRRQPAQQRRHREPRHADHEHAAAPEPVAQRAAEQDQRGQRQGVGVDGPLQAAEARAEVRADPRAAPR